MSSTDKVIKMCWLIALIILGSGIFFVILDDEDTRSPMNAPAPAMPVSK